MIQMDQHTLSAVIHLGPNEEFKKFIDWLRKALEAEQKRYDGLRGEELLESAIEAGALKNILKQVDTAQSILSRIQARGSDKGVSVL